MIDMDARGNKLSSCKIPDQYPKNKKVRTLATLAENKRNNSEYNSVVFTTLKSKFRKYCFLIVVVLCFFFLLFISCRWSEMWLNIVPLRSIIPGLIPPLGHPQTQKVAP